MLRTYKDDLPERIPLSRQKEFKHIKNIIIGEAAKLGEIAQEVGTACADDGNGADGTNGQSKSEPPPVPPARTKSTVLPGQVARSAASLLYQVGRIFEDQRPRSAVGPRVEVDSKLKRKIREKKIAMGHKPDDHEEGQTM